MKKIFLSLLLLTLILPLVQAEKCTYSLNAQNTDEFIEEIPNLNEQLQNCPLTIPQGANVLLANGNTLFDITNNEGTQNFYVSIEEGQLNNIQKGSTSCTQKITLNKQNFNNLLNNKEQISATISNLLLKEELNIEGCNMISSIRIFFAKLFGKNFIKKEAANYQPNPTIPEGTTTGKPEHCDETYLPGHREYENNKELWDSYSKNTDGVCQSQIGKGAPDGTCIHMVQLSINGNPYYLCWYNE